MMAAKSPAEERTASQPIKVYVPVLASFNAEGVLTPLKLRWEDGRSYTIDKVSDVRPAAAQKAGGQGDRYTITVCGKQSYLFFERDTSLHGNRLGRWFVERKG
jgi:hypothetical protein